MAADTPCIEFDGPRNKGGYGVRSLHVSGTRLAHRAALADKLGRQVEGVARHTCDNPPCINPDHLIEGTQADNIDDAVARGRARGGRHDQTHCIHGHELSPENVATYKRPSTRKEITARRCLTCRREANQRQAQRRKEARHARGLKYERKAS